MPQRTLVVVTRTHEGFYLPVLAHLWLARRGLGDPVAFLPADHDVSDDRPFMTYMEAAFDAGDPEHAPKAAVDLIRNRVVVDPPKLIDESVDLRRLVG